MANRLLDTLCLVLRPCHDQPMKRLVYLVLLSFAWTLPLHGNDDAMTAEELAQHLEVSSWVSKMHLQEQTLILQVFRVVNGKVADTPLARHRRFSDGP